MTSFLSLTLTPKSGWVTPLYADTIFGHLCWRIAYAGGDVDAFLQDMQTPAFTLSNALPYGYIPTPIVSNVFTNAEASDIPQKVKAKLFEEMSERKQYKKISHVPVTLLHTYREAVGANPPESLTYPLITNVLKGASAECAKSEIGTHFDIKTTQDRRTGRTLEGSGPYGLSEYRLRTVDTESRKEGCVTDTLPPRLWVLLKILDEDRFKRMDETYAVKERLTEVFTLGYGKRKSIGKGVFAVGEGWVPEPSVFECATGTHLLLLSNFVPSTSDPVQGLYQTFVKYGKLGEHRSIAGGSNFYKRPLVMIREGATFELSREDAGRSFVGRMVQGVTNDPTIGQYGYGCTLRF